MLILIACWFLFALPLMLAAAGLLGAHVFYCGTRQQSPGIAAPKFSFGKRNGKAELDPSNRLPDV